MAVTEADFRARFPEFDAVDEGLVTRELADAQADVSTSFGTVQDRATLFLMAHRIFVTTNDSGTTVAGDGQFPVTAKAADGVSQSHQVPQNIAPDDAEFYASTYGQRYLKLRNAALAGPRLGC